MGILLGAVIALGTALVGVWGAKSAAELALLWEQEVKEKYGEKHLRKLQRRIGLTILIILMLIMVAGVLEPDAKNFLDKMRPSTQRIEPPELPRPII